MLDGRKFEIDEKNSLLLRAVVDNEKKVKETPFARMYDKEYYFIRSDGRVEVETESNNFCDDEHHKVANYCADRELMCQRALHETLNRLLWRFSETHGGDAYGKIQGVIYFPSLKLAQEAIETVVKPFVDKHPDFVW